ncbi:oligosaccharide flippase family protein [Marinobacter sp. CHS3-4]|uniref:lipopolysaccharide biosynthesis protein n=1 Tax=Marinobacter sp. CHS3-4 TaxID=3045174 RepID=UPI0024B4D963|nr:oligosaccharide flippase family protein [Marinobacter sp. CHS3-4]MDI9244989.1 oligosaccharide flippase family protein [Marinobacter sp. CHS3-4]
MLLDIGFAPLATRFISGNEIPSTQKPAFFRRILNISLCIYVLGATAFFLFAQKITDNTELKGLILIMYCFGFVLTALNALILAEVQARKKFNLVFTSASCISVVRISGVILCFVYLDLGILYYFLVINISLIASLVMLLIRDRDFLVKVREKLVLPFNPKIVVKYALYSSAAGFLSFAFLQTDKFILLNYLTDAEYSVYTLCAMAAVIPSLLNKPIINVLFPSYNDLYTRLKKEEFFNYFKNSTKVHYALFLTLYIALGFNLKLIYDLWLPTVEIERSYLEVSLILLSGAIFQSLSAPYYYLNLSKMLNVKNIKISCVNLAVYILIISFNYHQIGPYVVSLAWLSVSFLQYCYLYLISGQRLLIMGMRSIIVFLLFGLNMAIEETNELTNLTVSIVLIVSLFLLNVREVRKLISEANT